jgi:hypothetical protein
VRSIKKNLLPRICADPADKTFDQRTSALICG